MNFCKFHGFGNDYIVFEAEDLKDVSGSLSEFAVKACHRYTGIGGDGIAVLEKLSGDFAGYSCRIINPDGSEAGFSGNGTRCAVAYLHYKNLWQAENLKLETKSGVKNYQLLKRAGNTFWFRAELGKPKFDLHNAANETAAQIARENNLKTADFSTFLVPGENLAVKFFYVDVGNPVACVFVEDFDELDWRRVGQIMEANTEVFPDRTNVVFIKTLGMENIEIRIWERGAGETSSSGTCSIAAAIAHLRRENLRGAVHVHAEGGTTEAIWRESDDEMLITGRADLAFCGDFPQ